MKNNSPELNLRVGRDQINGTHHPQEDSYDCGETPYGYFYVLADGMGGYGGGDIASQTVVEAFAASMAKGDSLDEALVVANKALAKVKKRKNLPQGAGCTLVAVTVDLSKDGVSCSFLSVGDSYIYYCPAGASMRQVNPLHENEDGSLYSALQGGEIEAVFTAVNALQLYPGDRLMLASDGLQAFGENKLRSLFRKYPVPPMQNQDADVIPGEAGDMVYRILHRLEEETELGLRQDPEYYQDNTSVMIVEWAPDSQEKPQQGRPVEVKLPFVLTRERGVMLGIIMCLVLVLCFVLWPNSGEVNKTEQNSAPVSQPAPQPQPATKTDAPAVELPDYVSKFDKLLDVPSDDYKAIVEAWGELGEAQKLLKLEGLNTWFYGDAKDNKEKFDCLMKRCNGLLRVCAKDNKQLSEDQKNQVDSMLALLLQSDGTTIESLLSAEEINGKIENNVLKISQIDVHIPHFRLLDLWLATKVKPDIVSKGEWLNWFIYEIDDSVNNSSVPKPAELRSEVRTKALEVDPEKLLAAYNDKKDSASKRNVKALLREDDFVKNYSKDHEKWIQEKFKKEDAKSFCRPLLRCLVDENKEDGGKLLNLGLIQDTLDELFPDKADEVVKSTAQKSLASATLDKKLDDLVRRPVAAQLAEVEEAYGVATEKGVTDCDVKVSTKVAELITREDFKNEIYKDERYLKLIWTNLLIGLVSEKKKEAAVLGLDVDKICKLLDNHQALHDKNEKWLDQSFAKELVWQFFTMEEKLVAQRVTQIAKDGNSALMDVLIKQLIEKKSDIIDPSGLIDYSNVKREDYTFSWPQKKPVPDSWKVYKYILFCIPNNDFHRIAPAGSSILKDNRAPARETLLNGDDKNKIKKSENRAFVEKLVTSNSSGDSNQKTETE